MNQSTPVPNPVAWKAGETIVIRGIWKGDLWWACPQYIVQDTPELIALYWCAGTPVRRWYRRPTVQEVLSSTPQLIDSEWTETDVLSLITPGESHSIDIMWDSKQHIHRCWYIQLQEPLRRSPIGFDTMDQILDIVISPERREWFWKDEDEFAEAEAIGVYSPDQARAIKAEGERVLQSCLADQPPFCDGWEKWRPPEEWGIPAFPVGWARATI
jgi:hypothetical protein